MDKEQWATIRRRIYFTLPWAGAIMAAYGIASESTAALWVGLIGAAIGPVHGTLAGLNTKPGQIEAGNQSLYREPR